MVLALAVWSQGRAVKFVGPVQNTKWGLNQIQSITKILQSKCDISRIVYFLTLVLYNQKLSNWKRRMFVVVASLMPSALLFGCLLSCYSLVEWKFEIGWAGWRLAARRRQDVETRDDIQKMKENTKRRGASGLGVENTKRHAREVAARRHARTRTGLWRSGRTQMHGPYSAGLIFCGPKNLEVYTGSYGPYAHVHGPVWSAFVRSNDRQRDIWTEHTDGRRLNKRHGHTVMSAKRA